MKYLILDTETTGLSDDAEIVEICIIDNNANVLLDWRIKPLYPVPDDVVKIHGITNEMLKNCAAWDDVYHDVMDVLHNRVVYAYKSVFDLCSQRQKTLGADHPLVEDFFETFNYLRTKEDSLFLDHSRDAGLVALNLNQVQEWANHHGQKITPLVELKKLLKTSVRYQFIDSSRAVNSSLGKSVRCWVFKKPVNESGDDYVSK